MGETEQRAVERLIDDFYAAALEPAGWTTVMEDVMRLFRGHGATLELHHKRTKELLFFEGVNVEEAHQAAYAEHYIRVCPRIVAAVQAPEGGPVYDRQFMSEREMDRSEFYQDFLAPCGMRYLAGLSLVHTADHLGVFGVHRAPREGHVDEAAIERLQVLMPHMRRSLQLSARLAGLEAAQGELRAALGELSSGVILIDGEGRVAFMNDAARAILPQTPLRIVGDQLAGRTRLQSRHVRQAVAEVLNAQVGEQHLPKCLVLHDHTKPHLFQLSPLPSPRRCHSFFAPEAAERVRAMVVFDSPSPTAHGELLQARYAMTPAEAACAVALAEGASPREMAAARQVALSTVRTLLARARSKTGARTQAELVRHVVATGRSLLRAPLD